VNNNNNTNRRMNKTAQELVRGQQVEWVRPDDLVDQALQKMTKHDLTALPVVEPSAAGSAQGTIKGFVDVLDLVAFLATVGTRVMTNPYGAGESRSLATDDIAILHRRSKEFRITNTVEISDFCKRNPLHKVNQSMNVKDLIHFFGKTNEYIHRCAPNSSDFRRPHDHGPTSLFVCACCCCLLELLWWTTITI
jgi:CBS domain containing-hemolysin-like protein